MSQTARAVAAPLEILPLAEDSNRALLRELLRLTWPVLAEHALHILVGWNDTYIANHIHQYEPATALTRADETAAGAAVGTMAYILWFTGLIVSAVGAGSTAIIARAIGARHRRLANSICGQSISLAVLIGVVVGGLMFAFPSQIAVFTGLDGAAREYAIVYLRILAISLPLTMLMFVANSCLRGAGDTLTPAIVMVVVDVINIVFTFGLTFGYAGLPRIGFVGIAWGTTIAYLSGGAIQLIVLLSGRGGVRLFLHRMRPHWHNMKRLLRIGIPGGMADLLHWISNIFVVRFVNEMGQAAGNAHSITIRIESMSYMTGFAFATAAATMVGQSLGMNNPRRAVRTANLAYASGGGFMILCGILFILFGQYPARFFSEDPQVQALVTRCLFITGFGQAGFAAAMIFGGSLRGAGDTFVIMLLLLFNMFAIRLLGAWIVARWLGLGLTAIWVVLAGELLIRGLVTWGRFLHGGWKKIRV